jgi:integrin alpha FG-GAP repeat containing protein 1
LIQSNFLALQTPYVFWGLGRPSNYVDYLWVGLPSGKRSTQRGVQYWPGIIPNSQVVIIPYPPELPEE